MTVAPRKRFWSAAESAAAGLPSLPGTRQGVERLVKVEAWRDQGALARRRSGKGGGWENSWRLFPLAAQTQLLAESRAAEHASVSPLDDPARALGEHSPAQSALSQPAAASKPSRDDAWIAFEALPTRVQQKARARLGVLDAVEALEATGLTRNLAVTEVAKIEGVGRASIWRWIAMLEGVAPQDRLAFLAPKHRKAAAARAVGETGLALDGSAGPAGGSEAAETATDAAARSEGSLGLIALDPRFFEALKGDYLRLEQPSFSSSYRRTCRIADAQGWPVPGERMARRYMARTVPRSIQIFARQGWTGLQRCYPPQQRDRSGMVALQHLNADCHQWDVFVTWPGRDTPVRPHLIAFQDTYSAKILSWRIDLAPNKVAVMAAFGDVVETYGIPEECLFDNGHEFANKWLTGGAKHRFRFKIREDEALGVLEQLGVKMHFARVAHGQAKPIERAFRDMADEIAKDPRFAGAYVGNHPGAKPENYGSRAVPRERFLMVVSEGIAAHNARTGRRGQGP